MNNEYYQENGNPYRQAEAVAKDWKKSKRRNWKRYALYKRQVQNDAIEAKTFTLNHFVEVGSVRHRDELIRRNLRDAIHIAKYLRELYLRLK